MGYMSNADETKAIRNLFKNDPTIQGYKLRQNGHGAGTAYGWIYVKATYPDDRKEFQQDPNSIWVNDKLHDERARIKWLIQEAVGRGDLQDDTQTDYFCVNISFDLLSESEYTERNSWRKKVKENRIKNATCPNCGTISKEFRRDGYKFVRCCRKCEHQWIHWSA